jgi:16S rRNA C1402 N4-methylase RsmH
MEVNAEQGEVRSAVHHSATQWLKQNGHPQLVSQQSEEDRAVEGVMVLTCANVAAKMKLINKIQNPYVKIYGQM